jgi:DNA repair protein RecO (recombination protein O)
LSTWVKAGGCDTKSNVEDVQTDAFILRTRAYGESDLIAVALTLDFGKVAGVARGARRSKRRFAGPALEPFQEVRLRFARRPYSDLAFLHECRVVTSHHAIAARLPVFAWASYLSELTEVMTPERDPCPDLYVLFRSTIDRLATAEEPEPVAHHYIVGLLDRCGWGPDFRHCGICADPVDENARPILDPRGSGVVCARHEAERMGVDGSDPDFRPSRRVISQELLSYVSAARETVPVPTSNALTATATALLHRLVDLHLHRELKSRRFLAEITYGERSGTPLPPNRERSTG